MHKGNVCTRKEQFTQGGGGTKNKKKPPLKGKFTSKRAIDQNAMDQINWLFKFIQVQKYKLLNF